MVAFVPITPTFLFFVWATASFAPGSITPRTDGKLSFENAQAKGCRGITGNDEHLDPLGEKKEGALQGIFRDRVRGFTAIGYAGCIAKIDNVFRREETSHLFEYREPANARIKHADR